LGSRFYSLGSADFPVSEYPCHHNQIQPFLLLPYLNAKPPPRRCNAMNLAVHASTTSLFIVNSINYTSSASSFTIHPPLTHRQYTKPPPRSPHPTLRLRIHPHTRRRPKVDRETTPHIACPDGNRSLRPLAMPEKYREREKCYAALLI
jgi:hypothetical protein